MSTSKNRIALWYIVRDELDYLLPSIESQWMGIDLIFVLDSTPYPDPASARQVTERLTAAAHGRELIHETTLRFGSGFRDPNYVERNLRDEDRPFDEVAARNYAMDSCLRHGADILVQCDADEWYGPALYRRVRSMPRTQVLAVPECAWIRPDAFVRSPWWHVRVVGSEAGACFVSNRQLAGQLPNETLHCFPVHQGPRVDWDVHTHHHIKWLYGPKARALPATPTAQHTGFPFSSIHSVRHADFVDPGAAQDATAASFWPRVYTQRFAPQKDVA